MLLNEHTTLPANLQEDQSLQDFLVFLWYLVLQEILEVPARKKRKVRQISMSGKEDKDVSWEICLQRLGSTKLFGKEIKCLNCSRGLQL